MHSGGHDGAMTADFVRNDERGEPRVRWSSELRTVPEFASFVAWALPLAARVPRGDGHPVVVLPGLGGGDLSTRPLRWFLDRAGYRTFGWGLGTNRGSSARLRARLDELVAGLADRHGQPVSLVGWSLGGLHACGVARRVTASVRDVVTLGSPLLAGSPAPVGIPHTSIFSRSDAIVPWGSALVRPGHGRQNVEVDSSHLGLGHHPAVLVVVADRLAQPVGRWTPFTPPAWAGRWFATRPAAAAG